MLRNVLLGCVAVFAGSGFAAAAAQDDLKAAAQKLADADGYSWKTTVQAAGGNNNRGGGGPIEGMIQKEGYIVLTMTRGDNKTEVIRKGEKVVVKTDDGWKTPEELGTGGNAGGGQGGAPNPARMAARMAQNFQPPAAAAMELAGEVKELTANDNGFAGQLSEDAAKKALTFRGGRRGGGAGGNAAAAAPQITNPKGEVKFTTKDGVLVGYELHVTGSIDFNGNTRDVDRTTTVAISDVGSTKIDVPDDAKKKLSE